MEWQLVRSHLVNCFTQIVSLRALIVSLRAPKIGKLDTSEVKSERVVKKEKKRKHEDDYGSTQVTVSGLSHWHI